jgi:hypothetical protein
MRDAMADAAGAQRGEPHVVCLQGCVGAHGLLPVACIPCSNQGGRHDGPLHTGTRGLPPFSAN